MLYLCCSVIVALQEERATFHYCEQFGYLGESLDSTNNYVWGEFLYEAFGSVGNFAWVE